jgi:hypothetical protein
MLSEERITGLLIKSFQAYMAIQNLEKYNLGIEVELRYLEGKIQGYVDVLGETHEDKQDVRYRAYLAALELVCGNN